MLRWKLVFLFVLIVSVLKAQDSENEMKQKIYHGIINVTVSHSVPEIWPLDVPKKGALFLDTRAKKEFDVSHIPRAKYVGYEDFDLNRVKGIDKDVDIILYCSVGYRSEKIAEKLIKAGYTKVKNLYGGVFEWSNVGLPLVDGAGVETKRVHGYSLLWGKWLNAADVVYDD